MDVDTLDVRGKSCPLPILETRKVLRGRPAGSMLRVLATDAGAVKDFAAFCRQSGDRLVESTVLGDAFSFMIEKQ